MEILYFIKHFKVTRSFLDFKILLKLFYGNNLNNLNSDILLSIQCNKGLPKV